MLVCVGGLTPLQRSSLCILQPQLTRQVLLSNIINSNAAAGLRSPAQCSKSRTDSRMIGSQIQLGDLRRGDAVRNSQASSSFSASPTSPSLNSYYNRPSCHWPYVKSCLVGGKDKQITLLILISIIHSFAYS